MKKLLYNWRKGLMIGFGALIVSTLGIQASDELRGVAGNLSGFVGGSNSICGTGAELILFGTHSICMDIYEASPNSSCQYSTTNSEVETEINVSSGKCGVVSIANVLPWRHVAYTQAQQLCARSGKRLPTNSEWYKVSLGLSETSSCALNLTSSSLTGVSNCISQTGIHDLIGNVWEWVEGTVNSGNYNERLLPDSGYVSLVDEEGIVISTSDQPENNFGADYAWINKEGVRGILRGGFYGSGTDGGIFSQNLAVPLNFSAVGVGFRCVKDI